MKTNNTAKKTLQDAEKIAKALKEGTEKNLKSILSEAIDDMLKDDDAEKEDEVKDEPIVDDSSKEDEVDTEEEPEISDVEPEDGEEKADDVESEDEEWSDMEDYKVGDDDYDLTNADDETAIRVYNKLGDDDQIFITKEDDGSYTMKDEETGKEYEIELSDEDGLDADAEEDFEPEDEDSEIEVELDTEEEPEESDDEIEVELDDDDEEEALNEDLGYTDSYQKDVFAKPFNMSEPGKDVNDWDEGAPKGSEKPWAGKGNMKPFGANKQELDEGDTISQQPARKMVKTKHGQHRPNNPEEVKKVDSPMNESMQKVIRTAKAIMAENKQYKDAIESIKKSLYEAAVLNYNYGKIVNLLINETTTKEEKKNIVERFSNVKTINEGNELYASFKKQLNEAHASSPILERNIQADSSRQLNETTIYQPKNNPCMNLMERMDNLYKANKK